MILSESKRVKLLNFLRLGVNPFKNFVSTGELKEELRLVKSRVSLFEKIKEKLENEKNLILPIIGDIGVGKTHLYWHLRHNLYFYNSIYTSLETLKNRFFYTIYSELIEVLEVDVVRVILNELCAEWGANEKRFGFFHVPNIEKARTNALEYFGNRYNDIDTEILQDVINGILIHQLDPYKKMDAEEWLLGRPLGTRELAKLDLNNDLHKSKNAYTMLRVLIEKAKLDTILFIDDFEKIITFMKPKDEYTEEVFDPSWLYGVDKSPDHIASEKLLSRLIKLFNIQKLHLVITLKSKNLLDEIREKFKDSYPEFVSKLSEPIFIENFREEDIYEFYVQYMDYFYDEMDLKEFIGAFQNQYFPLNKIILKKIFNDAKGNPREIIKSFINIFNLIIYSDDELDKILENYIKSN